MRRVPVGTGRVVTLGVVRRTIVPVSAIVLVLGACTDSTSPLSPDDDFEDFFDFASDAGDVLLHNGD